jgi:hypothetical protein
MAAAGLFCAGAGRVLADIPVLAMAIYLAGMGLVLPQAQAGALLPFPQRAGAASSLMGVVQQTSSALLGAFLGHVLGATALPLAMSVAIVGCLALIVWALTRCIRHQRRLNSRSISQLSMPAAAGRRRARRPRVGHRAGGMFRTTDGSRLATGGAPDSGGRPPARDAARMNLLRP